MAHSVQNKVFLITGGANGIGASMVKTFILENPKQIVILDVAQAAGLSLQNELNKIYGENKVKFIKCDVTDEKQLKEAFNAALNSNGKIDVLINNAGILDDRDYRKSVEINLLAVMNASLKAFDIMRTDKSGNGGAIINIASIAALGNVAQFPIYSATKSAVLQFSICLGNTLHYSRTGVRVMSVCFGATNTEIINPDKITTFDEEIIDNAKDFVAGCYLQKTDNACQAVVEAFKNGRSGSTWLTLNDKPAMDITGKVEQAYALLGENLLTPP